MTLYLQFHMLMKRNLQKKNKKIEKESKKLTIFQRKLDKLLEEVVFLIGKHIAVTEMKICSKKSNLHKQFANIELNYHKLIAKRDEIFKTYGIVGQKHLCKQYTKETSEYSCRCLL